MEEKKYTIEAPTTGVPENKNFPPPPNLDDEDLAVWDFVGQMPEQVQFDADRNWSELNQRVQRAKKMKLFYRVLRNSAAILFLPLLIITSYLVYNRQVVMYTVSSIEYVSNAGGISEIILPDQSVVSLNGGSSLRYPDRFISDVRRVFLSGEAYFNVQADPRNRFEVQISEDLIISAYGTEFNICGYDDDGIIETILVKGNIEVVNQKEEKVCELHPGEMLSFDKNSGEWFVSEADLATKTAWREGILMFKRDPMETVLKKLSRFYNIQVEVLDPEIFDYEFTAVFPMMSLPDVLILLEKSSPICCEIEERKITDTERTRNTLRIKKK